jgi:hypothetical protein
MLKKLIGIREERKAKKEVEVKNPEFIKRFGKYGKA